MKNKQTADIFREIAQILELKGDNPFRVRAYERAAQNIENLDYDIDRAVKEDKLTSIPGIGKDLAGKIKEIVLTGKLKYYEQLKKSFPEGVFQMMRISGLGPKTVKLFYDKLKIDTISKLEKAARQGKLRVLEGIKEKTEENVLRGIEIIKKARARVMISEALEAAGPFLGALKKMKEAKVVELAGSIRRGKETIKDIDILVGSENHGAVIDKFVALPFVKRVLARGLTKSSVISQEGMQVDLRVVDEKSFGAALLYFTGSKDFNVHLRRLAMKKGYKINEYGVFKGNKYIAGRSEKDIFSLMKIGYIQPELRENRGEIEAAIQGCLPCCVELKDIKGDLHIHSKYSDGVLSIEEIAQKAEELGYEYIAVTDHSQSLKVAQGLSKDTVYKKIKEIKKVNKKFKKLKILMGTEVDILPDGEIDYPADILKDFDVVIAAVHTAFKQPEDKMTKRLVSACKNKYVKIIGHPTGGLWGVRHPYVFDLDEVLKAAADNNTALEINSHPQRLDLNDINAMKAKAAGAKIALGTDAHKIGQLYAMKFGLSVARRAWLEKEDIINCMGLDELMKWLKN